MVVQRPRLLAALVALVVLVPFLVACGGDPGGGGPGDGDPPVTSADEAGRPTGLGATISADDLTTRLADVGIVTYAAAGDGEPVAPVAAPGAVALTSWQVRNLTQQLNDVRGYLVSDLDDLVGTGSDGVPLGAVLAAWARDADTPGAALARELMGEQDWARDAASLVWPDAALTLFVNDLATDEAAGPARVSPVVAAPGALRVVPALAARAGLCSDLQQLLSSTLDTIVENLQVAPDSGVLGVLADIWNGVVQIAADAFSAAVEALTGPLMTLVRGAATVLAVLSAASSTLDPWTIDVAADPGAVHFSYGSVPDAEATFTATVSSGIDFEWPADVADCAAAAGVVLPDPGSAKGSPVTWQKFDNGAEAVVTREDTTLDAAGKAELRFKPGTETQQQHDEGQEIISNYGVGVVVQRTAIDQMLTLVQSLVLDQLPSVVQPVVQALLGPVDGAVRAELAELTQATSKGNTFVVVRHHTEPTASPSPVGTTTPAPDCASVAGPSAIPDGTWEGPIELDVLGSGNGVGVNSRGGGQMSIVVEDGEVVGGPWEVTFTSKGSSVDGDVTVRIDLTGTLSGTVTGTPDAPVAQGSSTLTGTAKATALGITQDVPIDESSSFSDTLSVESTSCDQVTATWIPSFNSRTNPSGITIDGTARWVGTPVG